MKEELSNFIYDTYQQYLKNELTNGVPFADYLADELIKSYSVVKVQ